MSNLIDVAVKFVELDHYKSDCDREADGDFSNLACCWYVCYQGCLWVLDCALGGSLGCQDFLSTKVE